MRMNVARITTHPKITAYSYPPSPESAERTNYDYLASVHGDFKKRFYYTLSGSLERYSLFGTQTSPRAGVSYIALRPHKHIFSGTRILFNYGDGVREPKLTDEAGSLYDFLEQYGGQSTIQQYNISRLAAPTTRTYEGGVEQKFISDHLILRTSYFHNEFGKEIEYVGLDLVPQLLPNLSPAQQQSLENFLQTNFAYELTLNSEAFRAQGVETTVESGIGKNIFFRGGYTYLDAVVQRSFTNNDVALLGPIPTYNGIPIGGLLAAGRARVPSAARRIPAFSRPVMPQRSSPASSLRPSPAAATTPHTWSDVGRQTWRQQPAVAQSQSRLRLRQARPGRAASSCSPG